MKLPMSKRPWNPGFAEIWDHMSNKEKQVDWLIDAIVMVAIIVAMLFLSGCSRMGATAYADFSESISGTVIYNVEGHGKPPGPQARVGVEADVRIVGGLKVAGGIEHRSFPETSSDRGEERAYVGARYRWEGK